MGALHSKLVLFYQVLSACTISTRASSAGIRLKRRMLVLRLTSNTVARCRCRPRRTVSAPKVFDSPLHLFSSFQFPPPRLPGFFLSRIFSVCCRWLLQHPVLSRPNWPNWISPFTKNGTTSHVVARAAA